MEIIVLESQEPIILGTADSGFTMFVERGQPEWLVDLHNLITVSFKSIDKITERSAVNPPHAEIRKLEGKRIRVKIEVLD